MERDHLYGRILGDFVVHERIDAGGHGVVYRCVQEGLNRNAVIKLLHEARGLDEVAVSRFELEARVAAQLDHPFAPHIYKFGVEPDGLLWIAMELVDGVTFETWLKERLKEDGPMPLPEFVPFFERLAEVVQHAHDRSIVHRDIKPSNVMVKVVKGELMPKLLDFGIAKLLDDALFSPEPLHHHGATLVQSIPKFVGNPTRGAPSESERDWRLTPPDAGIGSIESMPPEQWEGSCSVGPAADVYSLGVFAYIALTGKPPFVGWDTRDWWKKHLGEQPPSLGEDFPQRVEAAIKRALSKDPADRPSAIELANEFKAALESGKQLRAAAQHWQDHDRSPGLLWVADKVLTEVKRSVPKHTLGDLECSFVAASQRRARLRTWLRRAIPAAVVAAVVGGAIAACLLRSGMRARLAEQEASAQRAIAEARVAESEREQGRAALLHREPEAFSHLLEAYQRDPSPMTAFMLARAAEPRLAEKARLPSTNGRTWWATFSPDGSQIATADDRAAQIWDAKTYRLLNTLPHGSEVYQVLYTADGTRIVTIARAMVRVWDRHGGLIHDLRPKHGPPDFDRGAVSSDGRWLAAIDATGSSTCVWDMERGALVAELHTPGAGMAALAFSSDGWLATTGGEEASIFDMRTWKQVRSLPGPIRSLAFDAKGTRIVTGSATGEIGLWDIRSGSRIRQLRPFGESVDTIAFSSDGRLIASGSRDGMMQVWQADGTLRSQLNPRHRKVLWVEFDSVAGAVLAAHADGTVVVADVVQGVAIATLEGPKNIVVVARFGTNSRVVGASWDGAARVWDAASPYRHWGTPLGGDLCNVGWVSRPDARFLAVGCRNAPTRVWDTATDQMLAELPASTTIDANGFISAAPAVSAAGDLAAIAHGTALDVYDMRGGRLLHTVEHSAAVSAIAFADSGRALVSGALDGSVKVLRDAAEGGIPFSLQASGGVTAVALLQDGRVLVADSERRLSVHAGGSVLADFALPVPVISLRARGDRVVALPNPAGESGPPVLIDLASRQVMQLDGHDGPVFSARWVADERILTAGADGTARLWDGKNGRLQQTYEGGHRYLGDAVLLSNDVVIGGDADGLLRFWDVASGSSLWTLPAHKSTVTGIHLEGADIVTRGFTGEIAKWHLRKPEAAIQDCARSAACAIVRR